MSRIKVDTAVNKTATGPVDFPSGITGVAATFTGNVTVGGTITYDDVQNVDSVGVVTAGKGLRVTTEGIVVTAGVSTLGGGTTMGDSVVSYWGTGGDLQIYHNGTHSYISDAGTGSLIILADDFYLQDTTTASMIQAIEGAQVQLHYNGNKKIETTNTGVTVTGECAATSFAGDGSALCGVGGENDITSCLFI